MKGKFSLMIFLIFFSEALCVFYNSDLRVYKEDATLLNQSYIN